MGDLLQSKRLILLLKMGLNSQKTDDLFKTIYVSNTKVARNKTMQPRK